jgi:glycosyltransferase involved in cell wall biosynthesis
MTSARLTVAIVADLLEERWPSMDLMADMLMTHSGSNGTGFSPALLRPEFGSALSSVMRQDPAEAPPTIQRIAHRFWSYPRWLRQQQPADVYHIVDHSYAHLSHALPAGRVVVTCHDIDAFRALLPGVQRESTLPRMLVKRVLTGLQRAAVIVCDSEATRLELLSNDLVPADRVSVVPIAVHPACTAAPDHESDTTAAALTGKLGAADLLHVGSTIARKGIDTLLEVLARVAEARPDVKLWRVGGPFTEAQAALACRLGVTGRIVVLPFVTRPVLAALYRRAAMVLLPSQREGFGLPVIEAMACGTPILCSDLPVLREVGGDAAEYCSPGDPKEWSARIITLLSEREGAPAQWHARQGACVAHASQFSWDRYASEMHAVYGSVAQSARSMTPLDGTHQMTPSGSPGQ